MRQIFHPYTLWECLDAGMYKNVPASKQQYLIEKAKMILSDPDYCFEAMRKVVHSWPKSCEHNLTNRDQNRRAWLGQAACCIESGVPEHLTKIAWGAMNDLQRLQANETADQVIHLWEIQHLHYAEKVS